MAKLQKDSDLLHRHMAIDQWRHQVEAAVKVVLICLGKAADADGGGERLRESTAIPSVHPPHVGCHKLLRSRFPFAMNVTSATSTMNQSSSNRTDANRCFFERQP